MKVRVLHDYEALSLAAAGEVAAAVRERSDAVLLLPTGSTPLGMYRRLVEMHRRAGLSFSRTTFFNLDEYLGLPPDHPASYRTYMLKNLYSLIDADPDRIHFPDGTAPDPEVECERYEAAIRRCGGADLCVLGIGRNGHIGFNEPGAPFNSRTRVVRLAESTRRVNATDFPSGRVPERAITAGMATIFESRRILLLASGADKARAVAAAVEGSVSETVPASILQRHPDATLLLDQEAASGLASPAA
ncbi:Glucosamine-6-phosphate deaminase 1 [Rubrobacter xylanophilus DSM 9941]|uniref:glucosamine-6-phosphate deaminase n=1 Tax=Rubrobacter xylanophilus TaxID=49319 RepID=UPI001C64318D|nr:glucosamine-6-phosphate deaminase [Rubrobacter xylanophilus]QYJ15006.1 Glucosamine-6-phosphate deaminase 1 [Rubrobacter xylanophilus DSM 9941]